MVLTSGFCCSLHPCLDFMQGFSARTLYCIYEIDVIIRKLVFFCQKCQ